MIATCIMSSHRHAAGARRAGEHVNQSGSSCCAFSGITVPPFSPSRSCGRPAYERGVRTGTPNAMSRLRREEVTAAARTSISLYEQVDVEASDTLHHPQAIDAPRDRSNPLTGARAGVACSHVRTHRRTYTVRRRTGCALACFRGTRGPRRTAGTARSLPGRDRAARRVPTRGNRDRPRRHRIRRLTRRRRRLRLRCAHRRGNHHPSGPRHALGRPEDRQPGSAVHRGRAHRPGAGRGCRHG